MSDEETFSRDGDERGWRERLGDIRKAAGALLGTRTAIFQEELAAKTRRLARAAAGLGIACAFGLLTLLLLTALLVSLFASLLKSPSLGILAVLVVYAGVTLVAGVFGWKSLSRVRILDFPVTRQEIQEDWNAVWSARKKEEEAVENVQPFPETPVDAGAGETDMEARFRVGSE